MAHCSGCHHTFSTVSNFDLHRKSGKCHSPTTVGLVQNSRGTWRSEGERDLSELSERKRREKWKEFGYEQHTLPGMGEA